ncbi:hypothetical protein H6P81_011483 [Aristolochia fimbriata]|uniref:Synaptonemal complex protein 1 n=1 Tax=Aristolochia fimbriata TaxID=158543 RepID=A0AAV7EW44_ARIFI|nr:hypothetical protein H6P81_011483 [Aristolochia fimbriata]
MQKRPFRAVRSLDQLRSFTGAVQGTTTTGPISSRSSDSISYGNFTTLKLTAEKLVKEQASVKADLDIAQTKLARASDQIRTLEVKLQEACNENAMLKVKQVEDAKLWKGLDSKISSTKTLYDQLTESLQQLASQVKNDLTVEGLNLIAEDDKKNFEDKLTASSKVFDELHLQISVLSENLSSAEEKITCGAEALMVLGQEKKDVETRFEGELCTAELLLKEKDALIKKLEAVSEEDKASFLRLEAELGEVHQALRAKDHTCTSLRASLETLEEEKTDLKNSNGELQKKLCTSDHEMTVLKSSLHNLKSQINEFEKFSGHVLDGVDKMSCIFDTFQKLVTQERELAIKCAGRKFDRLHNRFLQITSENDIFQAEITMQKKKVIEQQKVQEFLMVQHAEECHIAEEKIRTLEAEENTLTAKNTELLTQVAKLEEEIKHLEELSNLTKNQMQELLMKVSSVESENKGLQGKLQSIIQEKEEEAETFQKNIETRDQLVESLQNQVTELHNHLAERELLVLNLQEKEKQLEGQKTEIEASLAATEFKLSEAKKQHDLMLEGKNLELTKHLNELSLKNDQAINEIRRKYEIEKQEIVNAERKRADKLVQEMEKKFDERIAESKEEAQLHLQCIEGEHTALLNHIQQDHEKKEASLKAYHDEEIQRVHLQAENELSEKILLLKREHEALAKSLTYQHEDECKNLYEELQLQKSKEEKQKALLHLQWKVMSNDHHEDPETYGEKENSISSINRDDVDNGNVKNLSLTSQRKQSKIPVSNLLTKTEKRNMGSVISIPKHNKKVTHHEYEVETSDGRTIKRRKTRSTVMFGDPSVHKRRQRRTPKAVNDVMQERQQVIKEASRRSNIGDLFSEGSLNPYADDPYTFG